MSNHRVVPETNTMLYASNMPIKKRRAFRNKNKQTNEDLPALPGGDGLASSISGFAPGRGPQRSAPRPHPWPHPWPLQRPGALGGGAGPGVPPAVSGDFRGSCGISWALRTAEEHPTSTSKSSIDCMSEG